MNILHVCADWQTRNAVANAARLIGREQEKAGHSVTCRVWAGIGELRRADEVWIHGAWSSCLWWAALWSKNGRWMPDGEYDPIRLRYHAFRRFFFSGIERFFLRRVATIVALCKAEIEWVKAFAPYVKNVETTDLKRFYELPEMGERNSIESFREHVYCGRRFAHLLQRGSLSPYSGSEYLRRAAHEVSPRRAPKFELRRMSDFRGSSKKRIWEWVDILVLPTLSDSFGLVIAEALSMGKCVLTTDGAAAWCENLVPASENLAVGYGGRLLCVRNFRDASHPRRVELLVEALKQIVSES